MVTACDVADAALFLASDLSSGITGALVPVDAGSR
jgi:enoyl-[acyl-carrier-protein] reductase (NADH)